MGKNFAYYIPIEQIINGTMSLEDHVKNKILYTEFNDIFEEIIGKDTEKEVELLNKIIAEHHPDSHTVLDLGCGVGRHLRELCKTGLEVTGLDNSEKMISASKSNVPKGTFHHLDFKQFRLDEKFDIIICMWSTFNYLENEDELYKFFKNVNDHLNQNGIVILDTWNFMKSKENCYMKNIGTEENIINLYIYKKLHGNYCESLYFYIMQDKKTDNIITAIDQEINVGYSEKQIIAASREYFQKLTLYGDFEGNQYDHNDSERLILVLRRG